MCDSPPPPSNINSDVTFNNYYHEYLFTIQDIDLLSNPTTGEEGIHLYQTGTSAWSNGTRVSEPWLDHEMYFAPCSARTREWTLTFDIEDNINFFASGMYTFEYMCDKIQNDCTGPHKQFETVDECVGFYYMLSQANNECVDDSGSAYTLQGNTTACRFLHHYMTQSSPEVHCYHVGYGHTADVHGHYRCVPEDCTGHDSDQVRRTKSALYLTRVFRAAALPFCSRPRAFPLSPDS